jgi:GrpB-like predicted nucleotidyltransferase (UPF0157 family)
MIEIAPYTKAWPLEFESEAAALRRVMGAQAVRIEHVGSTAVPGLAAKPVIDIQVSVLSLESLEPFQGPLVALGYRRISITEFDDPEYPWFAKPGYWPSTRHIHLCVAGSELEVRHIAFRDYLRKNMEQARLYEALKRKLAGEHEGKTLHSVASYSMGKSVFIENAIANAGLRSGESDA